MQLSIWPGGLDTNAKGTIDWAGGPINWDHEDVKNDGAFKVSFDEITVECWDADTAPGTNKGKSYIFNDIHATNDTVEDTNKRTTLKSFKGSGEDMDAKDPDNDSSGSVPGTSGGGSGNHGDGSESGGDGSGGSGSGSGSGCKSDDFSQNCGGSDEEEEGDKGAAVRGGASVLGVVVAVGALLLL